MQRGVRRHANDHTGFLGADIRHGKAVAGFAAHGVTLAGKIGLELIAERGGACCREPVIGESERAGQIERPGMGLGIDPGLEGIAPAIAESLCQISIGAAAGDPKTIHRIRRHVIIHAGGKAIVARSDIVASRHRVPVGMAGAAEG